MTLDIGLTERIFVSYKESFVTFLEERQLIQSNSLLLNNKSTHFVRHTQLSQLIVSLNFVAQYHTAECIHILHVSDDGKTVILV